MIVTSSVAIGECAHELCDLFSRVVAHEMEILRREKQNGEFHSEEEKKESEWCVAKA